MNKVKPIRMKQVIEKEENPIQLNKKINPLLPRIDETPKLMIIYGSVGVGKTSTAIQLIMDDECFGNCWDILYCVANTIFQDTKLYSIRNSNKSVLVDNYSDEAINMIIENQTKENEDDYVPYGLLFLEDALSNKGGCSCNHSAISKLATNFRHKKLCILINAQSINQISSMIRSQVNSVFLKKLRSKKEIDKFGDQYGAWVGIENFYKMYEYAFGKAEQKYNMLYFDLDNMLVWLNLGEKLLYDDEKLLI